MKFAYHQFHLRLVKYYLKSISVGVGFECSGHEVDFYTVDMETITSSLIFEK